MTLWYFITRRIARYLVSDSSFVGYLINLDQWEPMHFKASLATSETLLHRESCGLESCHQICAVSLRFKQSSRRP